ncbi:MAG: endonuclease V [Chitinophagales bacterium]|nr:endonuclease V [Chitinophagales bacterium]
MILAFDTYYYERSAKTVCLTFRQWTDEKPAQVFSEVKDIPDDYEPGAFYKRELPCIVSLLRQVPLDDIEAIIIDGFVVLDDAGKPGLGAHLFEYLQQKIPVIGVAKSNFAPIHQLKRAALRGDSQRPLYVTAIGTSVDDAAENIRMMYGKYRIPELLKLLDQQTRR